MLVLGIESSCDETALAIVEDGRVVRASLIASQIAVHAKWGGVIPEIAAREHLLAIQELYHQVLIEAKVAPSEIDLIGVTQGPGLVGCLLIGASFAKGLSQGLGRRLIPINHVHAHVHGAILGVERPFDQIFPALALVISGGHTNLYAMKGPTDFKLLGHTVDDACGESFDKVGKMLGLPYPGGPHIEKLALQFDSPLEATPFIMPKMMARRDEMNFSYSGLKTAVANILRKHEKAGPLTSSFKSAVAHAFQEEALTQIVRKLELALKIAPSTKTCIVAGGVAANQRFHSMLAEHLTIPVLAPDLKYCSDNGAMIAAMAYYERELPKNELALEWDVFSRYPFESMS